jgi:OmcA/MtrC family decaheme c-type cytochrome
VPRRAIVDLAKCQQCHTGTMHDNVWIPRLSLHGGNRTEEIGVCAICHNPNMTDIPYRTSGSEESLDLKRLAHEIHAGEMRHNPLVVVGFKGTTYDFSQVRFPGELKNCMNCHIDIGSKGTFELPLKTIMGSTINTGSAYTGTTTGYVDVNPANDLKITPTAAVCSACHDNSEVKTHMVQGGASFSATQGNIDSGRVRERCVTCHGPGKEKDVRKVHKDEYGD